MMRSGFFPRLAGRAVGVGRAPAHAWGQHTGPCPGGNHSLRRGHHLPGPSTAGTSRPMHRHDARQRRAQATANSSSSDAPSSKDQPQAPRFYHPSPLPPAVGAHTRLDGPEASHALKALRLREGDLLELCDSQGTLQLARVLDVQRKSKMTLEAIEEPRAIPWEGPRWTLAVALGSLKGGRADWLVEKACELGAYDLQPLLTDRSDSMGAKKSNQTEGESGREARLERVALAATKQSLRAHGMPVLQPRTLDDVGTTVSQAPLALVAVAGAPPMLQVLHENRQEVPRDGSAERCVLLVGPEGDFTPEELAALLEAGAKPVGLGANRLRTETAAIAALTAVQCHSDFHSFPL